MRDLMVGSRKGLIRFRQNGRGWTQAGGPDFLAEPVSFFMRDPRDNALYVALKFGHFGCKMHRSDDDGPPGKKYRCRPTRLRTPTMRQYCR